MVKPTDHRRRVPSQDSGSIEDRLARVLDAAPLAQVVPLLAPEMLHQLVHVRGVDACGHLLASATPAQLASVLDLELWQSPAPGRAEQFDPDRFGEWLEGLVEAGEDVAAVVVTRMASSIVVTGLSRYVRVFDVAACSPIWSSLDEGSEVVWGGFDGLVAEVGGYVVRARRSDAWDAIVSLLLALHAEHGDFFQTIMRGCRQLSNSRPEVDGLDSLLADPDQLLHDAGLDRQQRRSEQGYLSASEARAFLTIARRKQTPSEHGSGRNPIVTACLQVDRESVARVEERAPQPTDDHDIAPSSGVCEAVNAVAGLLAEARLTPDRPRALLSAPSVRRVEPVLVQTAMERLHERDERLFLDRNREIAFLANALMAGCSVHARPFTAQEASDAAIAACNLGLDHWPARWTDDAERGRETMLAGGMALPADVLVTHDLVSAFEVGWSVLHETSLYVADQLLAILDQVRCIDLETQVGLSALRRELAKQCRAGTPWRARDALDVLAILDTPAWAALLGALDECPVVPAVLTAIVHRHKGAISATAFEFVCSKAQLEEMRSFAERLPESLVR